MNDKQWKDNKTRFRKRRFLLSIPIFTVAGCLGNNGSTAGGGNGGNDGEQTLHWQLQDLVQSDFPEQEKDAYDMQGGEGLVIVSIDGNPPDELIESVEQEENGSVIATVRIDNLEELAEHSDVTRVTPA